MKITDKRQVDGIGDGQVTDAGVSETQTVEAVPPLSCEFQLAVVFSCPECKHAHADPNARLISQILMTGGGGLISAKCAGCGKPLRASLKQDVIVAPVPVPQPMNRQQRRAIGG